MRKKVTIVGSGNRGRHRGPTGSLPKNWPNVVLIDIIEGVPQGKGLDLLEAMPIEKRGLLHSPAPTTIKTPRIPDIVVITAGIPRKARHEPRRLAQYEFPRQSSKAVVGEVVEIFAEPAF